MYFKISKESTLVNERNGEKGGKRGGGGGGGGGGPFQDGCMAFQPLTLHPFSSLWSMSDTSAIGSS